MAKNRRPFQPYRIVMADGGEIQINHSDAVSWEDDKPRLAFALSGGEHHWIEVALITRIIAPIPAQPPSSDGGD
jgi:hypothetical protein